ncbi:MAG: hypothetical protein OEO79_16985 [Gemmatimonadota bacterium]|nr:hypothetical protein [Gemmatimonadota bacterium]
MTSKRSEKQVVQGRRIQRSESGWLQKALFALGKASDAHGKLSELNGETHEPLLVTIEGETYDIDDVTDAVKDAVLERTESLRVATRGEKALGR